MLKTCCLIRRKSDSAIETLAQPGIGHCADVALGCVERKRRGSARHLPADDIVKPKNAEGS